MTQVLLPYSYVADPTKSAALFGAQLYFGTPDEDPEITANQKIVNAVQEDGTLVPLTQPVLTGAGGIPEYDGSPVHLDIDGNYSYKVLDRFDAQVYYMSTVYNASGTDNGGSGCGTGGSSSFSGVVAEEFHILTAGQTTVLLTDLGANECVFFLQSQLGDQGFLAKDYDYTITNTTTIELLQSYNDGDVLVARQNDPTGQLIPVSENLVNLIVFEDQVAAAAATAAGSIILGDTFTLNGSTINEDGLGGSKWVAITTAFTNDDVNYFDLNTTLQAALLSDYHRFLNYSETIGTAAIVATVLNIDLNFGSSQTITMTESASDVTFINYNPDSSFSSTITLKVTQDGTGSWGITWPSTIKWSGGTAPTLTAAAASVDVYGFTTYDAGLTWLGFTLGQDFS